MPRNVQFLFNRQPLVYKVFADDFRGVRPKRQFSGSVAIRAIAKKRRYSARKIAVVCGNFLIIKVCDGNSSVHKFLDRAIFRRKIFHKIEMYDEIIRPYFSRDKHVRHKSSGFAALFKCKLQSGMLRFVTEKIAVVAVELLVRNVFYAYFNAFFVDFAVFFPHDFA